eukprot:2966094-Rhodomonas_salina.1
MRDEGGEAKGKKEEGEEEQESRRGGREETWPLTPLREKIMAPRGPRRDLWVVVVTTSANSKGSGTTLAATRPEMCA